MQVGSNIGQAFIKESRELQIVLGNHLTELERKSFKAGIDLKLSQLHSKHNNKENVPLNRQKKNDRNSEHSDYLADMGLIVNPELKSDIKQEENVVISEAETVEAINSLGTALFEKLGMIQTEPVNREENPVVEEEGGFALTGNLTVNEEIHKETALKDTRLKEEDNENVLPNREVPLENRARLEENPANLRGTDEKTTPEVVTPSSEDYDWKPEKNELKAENREILLKEELSNKESGKETKTEGFKEREKDREESELKSDLSSVFQRVKESEVKVSRTEKPEFVQTLSVHEQRTDVLNQIMEFTKTNFSYEKGMELSLNPVSLGKISIVAKQLATGVAISIACENARTYKLLSESSEQLGGIMQKRLGEPTVIHIQEQTFDYLQQNREKNDNGSGYGQERRQDDKNETDSFVARLKLGLT